MRNALICAGVMLAMLLLWPVVFGGTGSAAAAQPAARSATTVSLVVPPATPVTRAVVPVSRPSAGLETCGARHVREAAVCTDDACRQRLVDALDICEGSGFWPA